MEDDFIFEFFFDDQIEEFALYTRRTNKEPLERESIVRGLRKFADALESGETPLYGSDEEVHH